MLFVVVMFAQVVGFGTDQAGLNAFQNSGNTLGDLGSTYVGQWFSLLIIFTAIVSAFGCHLACSATSGRMLYAFGRDGFGPKALAQIHEGTGGPRFATWVVVGVALVVDLICGALGWPDMGTGSPAINTYFLFAVAGSVCLMVCYLLVEIAAIWFVGAPRFVGVHGGQRQDSGAGASRPRRGRHRGGAVVQRQGRYELVGCAAARTVLVRNRIGDCHRRLRHRQARRVSPSPPNWPTAPTAAQTVE